MIKHNTVINLYGKQCISEKIASDLTCSFRPVLQLDKSSTWYLGLEHISFFKHEQNVVNKKIHIVHPNNNTVTEHKLPDGLYNVRLIQSYIKGEISDWTGGIEENPTLGNIKLRTGNYGFIFDFDDSIGMVLGFKRDREYKAHRIYLSNGSINLTSPIYRVSCNLINGSFNNGEPTHLLHEFASSAKNNELVFERPSTIIYFPLYQHHISDIHIRVLDKEMKYIDFGSASYLNVRLHLHKSI